MARTEGRPVDSIAAGPAVDAMFDVSELAEELASEDPSLVAGPDAVESLSLRVRAVAYTRPLHDLESSKVRLGGESWAALNMVELGFHAIDVVALRMDFDTGARYDDAVAAVASLARLQVPALDDARRVGERVVEGLITGRSAGDAEAHQGVYGSWGPDGYVARRFDYALITEHVDEAGELYLRATDPAISVLIGALELDVESAQIAAELRLKELVKRGMLKAAVEEARRARYRSIAYAEQLRRQLSAARLQTTLPGTLAEVDKLIESALAHVLDRYKAERLIIASVTRTRDAAEDPLVRRRANQLIDELSECQRRHQGLQRRLIRARGDFREALAAQLALPPAQPSRVELERQLLVPVLRATLAAADPVALRLFSLVGCGIEALPDLAELTGMLCAMPVEDRVAGERVDDDVELVEAPGTARFDEAVWDGADALLASVTRPVRLSHLLAAAPPASGPVAHLVALRALHALDPGLSERARREESGAFLLATRDESLFEHATLAGDDLLLAPARLVAAPGSSAGGEPPMAATADAATAVGGSGDGRS